MSQWTPVVFSLRKWSRCRSHSSVCRWSPEGFGPNLCRCHNPSITRQQSTVKQSSGVMVHLLCLFPCSPLNIAKQQKEMGPEKARTTNSGLMWNIFVPKILICTFHTLYVNSNNCYRKSYMVNAYQDSGCSEGEDHVWYISKLWKLKCVQSYS